MNATMNAADAYLLATIHRHRAIPNDPTIPLALRFIRERLPEATVTLAGSHAKGTALRDSDLDFFASLDTDEPLRDLAPWLADRFHDCLPMPRNVAVRIRHDRVNIDLVPARRRPGSTDHTLWQSRTGTWIKTNVTEQTRHIQSSGLLTEMLALKLWSRHNRLKFPSFLQELAVIDALTPGRPISEQLTHLADYLATRFPTARLTDPGNPNNVVSETLMPHEKHAIADAAQRDCPSLDIMEVGV